MPAPWLALLLATTSTTGGSLFSDEPIPDASGGGGLFSDAPVPDVAGGGGGLFSAEPIPDSPGGEGALFGEDEDVEALAAEARAAELGDEASGTEADWTPPFEPRIRVSVTLDAKASVDTAFDRDGENVLELLLAAQLQIDADFDHGLSAYVAPRVRQVTAFTRSFDDRELLYLDTPEAYVTWGSGRSHLRVGTQIFAWGSSELAAPSDVLNPMDLRGGAVSGADPSGAKIPVLAAEAVTGFGPVTLRGVLIPFFTPSRFFVTGWDDAVGVVGAASGFVIPDLTPLIAAPTLDRTADLLLITDRPNDRPDAATLGLRATAQLGDLDVSMSGVYGWETLPALTVDPNVALVAGKLGESLAQGLPIDPLDPDLLRAFESVNQAIEQGRPLLEGRYLRRALLGADASWAVDPFVIKLDLAYTFQRTLYTQDFRAVRRPWLNASLGAEYIHGETLQVMVELFALTAFDLRSNERLSLLEPRAPAPSELDIAGAERTVAMPGAAAIVRWSALEGDLTADLAVLSTLTRGDVFILPSINYQLGPHQKIGLSALIFEGRSDSYGGYYSHNDRVTVSYRWSL